ncbi:MAG TPA: SEC-C domain-containing protein [Candidatus Onthousia excrementipullorum]|uniref:SEC-C domain-containing protein n=1 Tax=Candidatus Onthousia excrementipullorum TaxID=2840884 RepID=A0A9D1DVH2_9FIRM|nr:SEC-C domain-containing protein [Candidatus Onthousia excrementipullorum]
MNDSLFIRLHEIKDNHDLEFFCIDEKAKGNLEDILKYYSDEQLEDLMYLYYAKTKSEIKKLSHKTKVDMLSKAIKENIKNIFDHVGIDNLDAFDNMIKKGEHGGYSHIFIVAGFAFVNDEGDIFIADDVRKIYDKEITKGYKKHKLELEILSLTSDLMLNMGIVPKYIVLSLFSNDLYNLMTNNEVDELLEENEYNILKAKADDEIYYLDKNISYTEGNFGDLKDIIWFKRTRDSYGYYANKICDILKEISKILKGSDDITYKLCSIVVTNLRTADEIIEDIKNNYNVSMKKIDEISNIIYTNFNSIRFWNCGGKTIDEVSLDRFILDKKLDDDYLPSYIENLTDRALVYLSDNYSFSNRKDLEDMLLTYANNIYLKELEKEEVVDEVLECDNKEFNGNIHVTEGVLNGIISLYRDGDIVKVSIPHEIKGMLRAGTIDNEPLIMPLDDTIVTSYLVINGAIEKDVLKDILKEKEGIDLSIEELDEIVLRNNYFMIDNYYTIVDDIPNIIEKEILPKKKSFKKYKGLGLEVDKANHKMYELKEELNSYLNTLDVNKVRKEYFLGTLLILLNANIYSEEFLKELCHENNFSLTKKQFENVYNIIDKYKNDIPIWIYNGYTKREVNSMPKEKKVGRNDPCPCGSGKKYKKCCGK